MILGGLAIGGAAGLAYLAVSSGVALPVARSCATCPHCGGDRDLGSTWCRFCGQRYDGAWLQRVEPSAESAPK
jgi:hypothetical protein